MSKTDLASSSVLHPAKLGPYSWSQVILFLVVWLLLFALGSVFVSNPFWLERSASLDPNYGHVMYLHALLVGLAGLVSLVAVEVFQLRSNAVRVFILAATVGATVLVGLGSLFDATLHFNWFWLIVHVVGFFLLDATFIALLVGFIIDWRLKTPISRTLPFWVAVAAVISLELAALMGHAAGWILDFGNHPALIGAWAKFVGEGISDLQANLITSHSHEIVVGMLGLLIAGAAARGYVALKGGARTLTRVGLWFVMAGTVLMTLIYVVGGITANEPPALFTFGPGGANGIAGDDLVTGVGVMLGGLLALLGMVMQRRAPEGEEQSWWRPALLTVGWSWLLLVLTMIGAGFYIELNETRFGAGAPHAAGAAADAVFTFAHQDFAFFLLPAVIVLLTIADLYFKRSTARWLSQLTSIGTLVTFVGLLVYVFAAPAAKYGSGYVIIAVGMVLVLAAAVVFMRGLWEISSPATPTGNVTPGRLRSHKIS